MSETPAPRLAAEDYPPPLAVWPLERGATLSNHDWFPFYGHRFLASEFVAGRLMAGDRGSIGTAMLLLSESMRQDPAGTLPLSDVQLAALARFHDLAGWLAAREHALHGWEPVSVATDGVDIVRLGHPFIEAIVEEMWKRQKGRKASREAGARAVRMTRVRKKMREMNLPEHRIGDDLLVGRIADWLHRADLYITPDHLRMAMSDVMTVREVTPFPRSPKDPSS